jgi:hypothetical protein
MHVDKVSRRLGITIVKADMTEDEFWDMTLNAPDGFVAGWPFVDGTASLAVRTKSLKSFLTATRTCRKACAITPGDWQTPREAAQGLRRYQSGTWS